MAHVDPADDSIERFIVRHYRHDPQRRERRHVVVAAFDNDQEFWACMNNLRDEINARRDHGEPVDQGEHVEHGRQSCRAPSGLAPVGAGEASSGGGDRLMIDLVVQRDDAVGRDTCVKQPQSSGELAQLKGHAIEGGGRSQAADQ
jgi:hypothetical protein